MGSNSVFLSEKFTDRTLIESILASHFIIDYGFIKKVNDNKTVDVTHAKQPKTLDGKTLPATVTTGVEVLTIAGGGFSFKFDYKKGDKVLLLGLKNFIPKVEEVTSATETTAYLHYSRETLKAIPLCIFNDDAKVTVQVESGTMKVDTQDKIELNGNDKQFVTYAELDDALQELWGKIKTHTHPVSTSGSATAQTGTAATSTDLASVTLDLSKAKTKTIVTGG
ncbi:MAG: hypothetical protein J6W46_08285 [Spirochaetaceae bacterium]|nr:hypothetical protein [Spirochaetaceae bacterium]